MYVCVYQRERERERERESKTDIFQADTYDAYIIVVTYQAVLYNLTTFKTEFVHYYKLCILRMYMYVS